MRWTVQLFWGINLKKKIFKNDAAILVLCIFKIHGRLDIQVAHNFIFFRTRAVGSLEIGVLDSTGSTTSSNWAEEMLFIETFQFLSAQQYGTKMSLSWRRIKKIHLLRVQFVFKLMLNGL